MKFKSLIVPVALLLSLLLASCAQVYRENLSDNIGVTTSVVDQYENTALNLRKIAEGIEILCDGKQTEECKSIRHWYSETRHAFIERGNLLRRQLGENISVDESAAADFDYRYKQLKGNAALIGIGGIDHE